MHHNAFYWSKNVSLFFEIFTTSSTKGLCLMFLVILLLSLLQSNMRCLHHHQDRWIKPPAKPKMLSASHISRTVIHVFDLILAYVIMLAVMSYNAWMLVAVSTGVVLGRASCMMAHYRPSKRSGEGSAVLARGAEPRPAPSSPPEAAEETHVTESLLPEKQTNRQCGKQERKCDVGVIHQTETVV